MNRRIVLVATAVAAVVTGWSRAPKCDVVIRTACSATAGFEQQETTKLRAKDIA